MTAPASTAAAIKPEQSAAEEQQPKSREDLQRALQQAKQNLTTAIQRKKDMDRDLANTEYTLFNFETSYLSPPQNQDHSGMLPGAAAFGNVVKGYDSYLKAASVVASSASDRKRNRASMYGNVQADSITPEDRIFSNSSESFQRSLEMKSQGGLSESANSDEESSTQPSRTKRKR